MPAADIPAIVEWRRHLHSIPELGSCEFKTSEFVAAKLASFGIEVHPGIGGTGVVGILKRGTGGRSIALRADMDALKISEQTNLPYASTHSGIMHACGHDGHTAMLLGAAQRLAKAGDFSGTIVFVFQPNEEHGKGARAMLDDGLLKRFPFQEAYGLHNMPGMPVGAFATRPGPLMAAEDNFEIIVTGRGGHAAQPHKTNDPILAATHIVLALQAIVSRRISALDSVVLSVTDIFTDGTRNVLPQTVTVRGDCRTYTKHAQARVEDQMRELSTGIAQGFGAAVEVSYTHDFAATVNDETLSAAALSVAQGVFGPDQVDAEPERMMGSEDFGLFLSVVPGNFAFLGNGIDGANGEPLHNPHYDFNDAAIPHGIDYWCALATSRLKA